MAPYSECNWFDHIGLYADRKSFQDNYRNCLHLLTLWLREIWSVSVSGNRFWGAQAWIRIIWVLHFVFPKSSPSFCEQAVVIIAGAIKVMGRSISETELLCQGCWGCWKSAASHFYLLRLIQHCPFEMWSCHWAELSEVCCARCTSVLRSTINNHETVASVKWRAHLSHLLKMSMRNKTVMTEMQSADFKQGSVHEPLQAGGQKNVLPSEPKVLTMRPGPALVPVLHWHSQITPSLFLCTSHPPVGYKVPQSTSIWKRNTWEMRRSLVCLYHFMGKDRARCYYQNAGQVLQL